MGTLTWVSRRYFCSLYVARPDHGGAVYYVLLHLYKRLPLGSFFKLLEDGGPHLTPATRLLEVYARQQNREMLRDFYYSDDRRVESAILCLEEATWMRVCLMTYGVPLPLIDHRHRNPAPRSALSRPGRSSSQRTRIARLRQR